MKSKKVLIKIDSSTELEAYEVMMKILMNSAYRRMYRGHFLSSGYK